MQDQAPARVPIADFFSESCDLDGLHVYEQAPREAFGIVSSRSLWPNIPECSRSRDSALCTLHTTPHSFVVAGVITDYIL